MRSASCYLDLQNQQGTCLVKQFIYYLEMNDGRVVRGTASPGGGPLEIERPDYRDIRPGKKASENLYGLMARLQSEGFHIIPESQDPNDFLKPTFGSDAGYTQTQQGTGADSSIKVFRVLETVLAAPDQAQTDDEKADSNLFYGAAPSYGATPSYSPNYEIRKKPGYMMIRGGDTILWMKTRQPNPRNTP